MKKKKRVRQSPKKVKKGTLLTGFDVTETPKHIENMLKYSPAGNWRNVTKIKVNYTHLIKEA